MPISLRAAADHAGGLERLRELVAKGEIAIHDVATGTVIPSELIGRAKIDLAAGTIFIVAEVDVDMAPPEPPARPVFSSDEVTSVGLTSADEITIDLDEGGPRGQGRPNVYYLPRFEELRAGGMRPGEAYKQISEEILEEEKVVRKPADVARAIRRERAAGKSDREVRTIREK